MALSFPNQARSYDEVNRRIRFLGHDGMFEVRFLLPVEMLAGDQPYRTASPGDHLKAFDALRPDIQKAAEKAYKATRQNLIVLDLRAL